MTPEAYRAALLKSVEAASCHWTRFEPAQPRHAPPGADDFWKGLKATMAANMRLISSRLSVPILAEFSARFQKPAYLTAWKDVITYVQLTRDIQNEDTCAGPKIDGYCVHNTVLTLLESNGKDGRAEAERLTATRVPAYDPWFVLGKVTVEVDGTRDSALSGLGADRMLAQEAYERAQAIVTDCIAALDRARAHRDERREALYALPRELAAEIDRIETQGSAAPGPRAPEAERRALDARIDRLYDRREKIGRALDSLHGEYPADNAFAGARIAVLNAELAEMDTREAALDDRMQALPQTRRAPATQAAGRSERPPQRRDRGGRQRPADRGCHRRTVRTDLRNARTAQDAAEDALMALDDRIARHRPVRIARVIAIRTEDTEIRIADPATPDLLAGLNETIQALRKQSPTLEQQREAARVAMIAPAARADAASKALADAGLESLLAQVRVEFAFSAHDIRNAAATGGPGAALVEGGQQFLNTALYPPGYTDQDQGRLTDYMDAALRPRGDAARLAPEPQALIIDDDLAGALGNAYARALVSLPAEALKSYFAASRSSSTSRLKASSAASMPVEPNASAQKRRFSPTPSMDFSPSAWAA